MNRLTKLLQHKKNRGEKVLSIFLPAGYPELDSTPELVIGLEQAGADFVEIGVPFSDPIADGPTIQRASQVALNNGMTLNKALTQVHIIRQQSQIPIVLMGYFNPFLKYGLRKIIIDSESAGVDGFIIPDLIPEEFQRFEQLFSNRKLGMNFLIAPNTPTSRIKTIDNLTSAFVYCVSVTGVTGMREGVSKGLIDFLNSIKKSLTHPFLVGFGVANSNDASLISQCCDGVIVGSAIINLMEKYDSNSQKIKAVSEFVNKLKMSIEGVSHGH